MSRSLKAAMRRAARLMRPPKRSKAARSMQKAMTGFMLASATAPFTALKPKKTRRRKPATPRAGRSLGAVVAQLRAAQARLPGATPQRTVTPRIPAGAQYLARTHRSATGTRDYKLYLPAGQAPKGLILMLHGCGQTPDDFAVGTRMNAVAQKHGLAVAWPAQLRRHNRASCWNWFQPAHQMRGAGEPAILASLTRKLTRELGLDRDAVFVAGLSAGAAMAAILADTYPDLYAAAGMHSGLARGSAHDAISGMKTMRRGGAGTRLAPTTRARPVRRIVFQGAADSTVHPMNAALIVAAALGDEAVATRVAKRAAGGRGYARSDYAGPDCVVLIEFWMVEGAGHAWSGGRAAGSFADRKGPDASAHMVRFFLARSP
jgi:poly(hydroxyalkanoate) depolymerase family esterase